MTEGSRHLTHSIHGTIPPDEWAKFFKKNFVPNGGKGGQSGEGARAATTTGSCTDVGCPSKHPISGTKLTGCSVEISHGKVVSVNCHYEPVATQ